jgi:hypothetical protein
MFNLNKIDLEMLKEFVDPPAPHIEAFTATFEACISANGANSFIPMVTYFDTDSNAMASISSIPYEDKDSMYKSFNEMLHYFSASEAHSLIFACDIRKTIYDQDNPDSKSTESTDALSLCFASEESSGILTMPYSIVNDTVQWSCDEFQLSNMANEDPTKKYQGDMVELFYLMTHLTGPLFTVPQLLNYYTYKGYQFMFPETTKVSSIKVDYNAN